ncbi:single-stranded DNA-binding protein [Microbacterium sp. ZXX196]|uniref:single-stranded DNA-binding protein n=1 Tax=Microbacterium sp. ZXX196 TaxID=2609291 RepID=UPI0012B80443|nr:single-stranded DNA-binding protein [Microbacterium sp. ZXX196]MTE24853.1 single-stranded DNA-binding protein [Microbacterium sp. ZXX196]
MSKAEVKIEGFVAQDPELRYHEGRAVTNVSVPHTPRRRNAQGQWEDAGPTLWVQASFWEQAAEAVAAQVRKGTLVTIEGVPDVRVFTTRDGQPAAQLRIKFGTLGIIPRVETPQAGVTGTGAPQAGDWSSAPQNAPHTAAQDAWANTETPF